MYAVIKSGGKQYRVKKGDVIDVEFLEGELGSEIEFGEILFFNDGSQSTVGGPKVPHCSVRGKLMGVKPGKKIQSMKYQPGNHYKKFGHRQKYSSVLITDIEMKKEGGKHGA
jgi:large subunit ribosomal protein L21